MAALWLAAPAAPAQAQITNLVGSPTAGTVWNSDTPPAPVNAYRCRDDERISGVGLKHNRNVIDWIRVRCTTVRSDGTWGSHDWKSTHSPSSSPLGTVGTETAQRACNTDRYIKGFTAYRKKIVTGPTVISALQIACPPPAPSGVDALLPVLTLAPAAARQDQSDHG